MSLVSSLLPVLPTLNAISGTLGLNTLAVSIETRVIAEPSDATDLFMGRDTSDDETVTTLELLEGGQNPTVEYRPREAVLLGISEDALIRVGPITPMFDHGGYSPEELRGSGASVVRYLVTDADENVATYKLHKLNLDDPLGYYLDLVRA